MFGYFPFACFLFLFFLILFFFPVGLYVCVCVCVCRPAPCGGQGVDTEKDVNKNKITGHTKLLLHTTKITRSRTRTRGRVLKKSTKNGADAKCQCMRAELQCTEIKQTKCNNGKRNSATVTVTVCVGVLVCLNTSAMLPFSKEKKTFFCTEVNGGVVVSGPAVGQSRTCGASGAIDKKERGVERKKENRTTK